MTRGVVIGKFYPPHKGHHYLIDYALGHVDSLTVLVCDSPAYKIPATTRKQWLQHIHPKANVIVIPDLDDDDNSELWANYTLKFLGYKPDFVFSSENYGVNYARFMNTKHVMVDLARIHVPISATRIRKDMMAEWDYLDDVVKEDLAKRIVIVGAESTGTTTLAKSLAQKFRAPWVPEYGRLYSEALAYSEHTWKNEEFEHIAAAQQSFENEIAVNSNGLVICDTNAFATTIWQERYMGTTTKAVQAIADKDLADLYIVTGDEIPFVQDGTRDGENIRHDMHKRFHEKLSAQNVPCVVVTGSKANRLKVSFEAITELISKQVLTL